MKVCVKNIKTGLYWSLGSSPGGEAEHLADAFQYDDEGLGYVRDQPEKYLVIPVGLDGALPTGEEGKRVPGQGTPEELAKFDAAVDRELHIPMPIKLAGKKFDGGKAPIWQGFENYFANSILGVAWVSEYGDRKYTRDGSAHYTQNWAQVENGQGRYKDAEGRHRLEPARGHDYDEESGLSHLQQKAWNAMADLERAVRDGRIKLMRGNEIDANGKPIPGTAKEVS